MKLNWGQWILVAVTAVSLIITALAPPTTNDEVDIRATVLRIIYSVVICGFFMWLIEGNPRGLY